MPKYSYEVNRYPRSEFQFKRRMDEVNHGSGQWRYEDPKINDGGTLASIGNVQSRKEVRRREITDHRVPEQKIEIFRESRIAREC
jgi:hypothetical protein